MNKIQGLWPIPLFFMLVSLASPAEFVAQICGNLKIQLQSEIPSTCNQMAVTMIHDKSGRPYLYVANKEAGLKIYNLSNPAIPKLAASVPTSAFNHLDVMNLDQNGNFLHLAIGNHFTNPQQGGMVIVDVTNPNEPAVTDFFVVPGPAHGAGIVKVQGDFAYLGAMRSGLVILDVSDKQDIRSVSQFIPDIHYPVPDPSANLYNVRGLEVKGDLVYLGYDAGGLRIINCANKLSPVETGRYANPALYKPFNLPRAYNNLVLDDTLIYSAVDYCGMEVINVSDTANLKLEGWWNPYHCPTNNWFTSPVHTNEIQLDKKNHLLFMSSGRSDAVVLDVSVPSLPLFCTQYGDPSDAIATWGLGIHENEIYLSYICALGIPFLANWTGIKILSYTPETTPIPEVGDSNPVFLYPNPAINQFVIEWPGHFSREKQLTIFNAMGQKIFENKLSSTSNILFVDTSGFEAAVYFVRLLLDNGISYSRKMIISKKY